MDFELEKKRRLSSQIPLRAAVVCAYVIRRDTNQFLLLKRQSRYMYGLWQQVAGGIEEGESAVQAILREIREETGHPPRNLYSADIIESFYEVKFNVIEMIPVFVAEFDTSKTVILSVEHSEYKWVSALEAREHANFAQQRKSIEIIEHEFILKTPEPHLKIEFTAP